MKKWKTVSKEVALKTKHLTIVKAEVEMPNGVVTDYFHADSPGTVVVIPVKPGLNPDSHTYLMVRQYRYPVGSYDLEFPAGRREPGEAILDAALRELKQETGYLAKEVKLLYSMYSNPGGSNGTTAICLAVVDTDTTPNQNLDPEEELSELKVEEVTAVELHKKILSMDITDSHTLAAVAVFIMNSKSATQYLGGRTEEE
jgi:ADP-ribose pyrophosphatase